MRGIACAVLAADKAALVAGERSNNSDTGEEVKILGCVLVQREKNQRAALNRAPRVGRGSLLRCSLA